MFYMNAQLLLARTWTTRLGKNPKLLRQLKKSCKSMASGVMYPYSGNTNSNNSNVGGTFRRDMTGWTQSYPTPLRPTGSVSGGVQVGGMSRPFSPKSLLPSKISPGEHASMLVICSRVRVTVSWSLVELGCSAVYVYI